MHHARSRLADVPCTCRVQSNDAKFETDNQILSLTDQLNLGLRNVELDTHWVQVSPLVCPHLLPPIHASRQLSQ